MNSLKPEWKKYTELSRSSFVQGGIGELDNTVFTYMIEKAKAVQKNKMSNFEASKQVGEKLVDTFIKPKLEDKNKPK